MTLRERATLIADIRRRLPLVAVGHPELASEIAAAMNVVESSPVPFVEDIADTTSYLWGLVLSHHAGGRHRGRAASCPLTFCSTIRHAVDRQRRALMAAGEGDPTERDFKPEHRP